MTALSSWFKGIKGKLLFAAVLPVVALTALGVVSYSGVTRVVNLLNDANNNIIPTFDTLGEMRQARINFGYQTWSALGAANPDQRARRVKAATDAIQEFAAAQELYGKTPMDTEEASHFEKNKGNIETYLVAMKKVAKLLETNTPENNKQVEDLMNDEVVKVANLVKDWNLSVKKMYHDMAVKGAKEGEKTQKSVINTVVLVTLFSAFLIFGILLWFAANISGTVSKISDKLMSAGTQVATSVEQLNEAGNGLSQSSTEAAASLEETVAALEEMTSMVQMNSDNAKQAAALSATSREAAESGEKEIQSLIHSMTTISQSSKKIEEIISVIDDIAFQTNLLALNAAVEAARAGEQGKGFAVVAEAVRTLALRSAEAAKDITTLIKESVNQIEDGRRIADQSGTVLTNITNSVKKVSDLNNEIAAASSEQTTGIQQISKAMNQLDQSSQANAASAEEIAATSGEISNLAVATQGLTFELNAIILGGSHSATDTAALETKPKARTTPAPVAKAPSKMVPFKKATPSRSAKHPAAEAIPFDEDDRAKVGTTDGF